MREWREARAVARLKLRAGEKIVNARLELKVLSDGRACRSARGNRARGRLIIEVGREVALNAEMFTEVPNNRRLKSRLGGIVSPDSSVGAKANATTARFAETGIAGEHLNLRILVLTCILRRRDRARAH